MKRLLSLVVAALVVADLLFLYRSHRAPRGTSLVPAVLTASAGGSVVSVRPTIGGSSAGAWSADPPRTAPKTRHTSVPSAVVYVAGAVRRPGVYALPAEARVGDALARAGGGRRDADLVAVNLAARLHDGDEIAVPILGAAPPPRASARGARRSDRHQHTRSEPAAALPSDAGGGPSGTRGRRARRANPPPDSVDLNSADERTLQTLPGVGPALAARIVLFRAANGPFGSVDELLDVAGITERRLELISPYVEVH